MRVRNDIARVFVTLALCGAPAAAQGFTPYDGCGVVIFNGCEKLLDDATGEEYTGDFAPFTLGDHVHVVGVLGTSLFFCAPPIDGEFDHGGGFISLIELCPDADPSTPLCFGDGTNGACPCANFGAAGEGCANSQGHGAVLSASGSASHAVDDLVLHVAQARPQMPGSVLQGASSINAPFRDGLFCMGNPTERIEFVITGASGTGSTTASIVTEGNVPGPGATRYYQFWYRDPVISPCGTGSNLTNALRIDWVA